MRKGFILTLVFLMTGIAMSYGQFSFGVSPGLSLNSAYFGYKINNKVVPYVGFQYLNANFKYEETGERYDWDLSQVVSYSDEIEFSGSVYIPNLGVKYFLKETNSLKAYTSLNVSKPILSGKLTYDGEVEEDLQENVKNVSLWGGEFSFGVEYFFDEHFSLGGEFGLRYIHVNYQQSYDTEIYDPNSTEPRNTTIEDKLSFNTSPTFSKISLNYYF